MLIKQVTIIKPHASYSEMKSLASLLKSDDIKNNGKIVIKCDIEANVLTIRKHIKELLNVSYSDINCTYLN